MSLDPVIKYENIDPGEFITKEDPDSKTTGFIADIKIDSGDFIINEDPDGKTTGFIGGIQIEENKDLTTDMSLNPVIKYENIDPGNFIIKEDPDCKTTGFIADIKIEENQELFKIELPIVKSRVTKELSLVDSTVSNIAEMVRETRPKMESDCQVTHSKDSLNKYASECHLVSAHTCKLPVPITESGVKKKLPVINLVLSNSVKPIKKPIKQKSSFCKVTRSVKALIPRDKRFPVGEYKCYCCDKEFSLLSHWENHIIDYLKFSGCYPYQENERLVCKQVSRDNVIPLANSYKCAICSCEFSTNCRVVSHIQYRHHKLSLRCAICPKLFQSNRGLKKHFKNVHDPTQKIYKCSFCPYSTRLNCSLKNHVSQKHSKDGNMKCDQCYMIISKHKIHKHNLRSHTPFCERSKYSCHECAYVCDNKSDLNRHIQNIHVKDCKYFCFYCNYTSSNKLNLNQHIHKRHLSDLIVRNVKCDRCPLMFRSRQGLHMHVRMSHKEKPIQYPCQRCDLVFTEKYQTFMHTNVAHLSQNELQCNECKFLAMDTQGLRKHVFKNHIYVYYCAHCSYTCRKKSLIAPHITQHHIAKEDRFNSTFFKCISCKYMTPMKSLLKQHMNVKHNPNPILYTCFHCGHKNKIKHKLSQHMQTKHKDLLKKTKKNV